VGWRNLPTEGPSPLEVEMVGQPLARGNPNMLRGRRGEPQRYFALLHGDDAGYGHVRITRARDADDALAELEPDTPAGSRFRLFVPQIWPISGYTQPEEIALELLAHVGRIGMSIWPGNRPRYGRHNEIARRELGTAAAFEIAHRRGGHMRLEQIIDRALAYTPPGRASGTVHLMRWRSLIITNSTIGSGRGSL
jgi:hypothetical protein